MPKQNEKIDYVVTESREIAGTWRQAGEPLSMTERQAKYYLPPYGSGLAPADDQGTKPAGDGAAKAAAGAAKPGKSSA